MPRLREAFDVILPRAMATLASGAFGRLLAGDDALVMRILEERIGDFLMA